MNKFPKRKQIRIQNYDYSQNGYYFITICTKDKQPLFWNDENANLSEYGQIVDTAINAIPKHYTDVKIDKYVIMPNHIHLILVIMSNGNAPTIMTVVGQMKRWVSKEIGCSIWQKSYYEHIIRDENDYLTTSEYILNNPLKRQIITGGKTGG